jgi:DNA topoisomerase-6 subunit B
LAVVVHLASVWVPFTSEAKEAVAHYDDLMRELRLAVQECGRKLATYLRAQHKAQSEQKRLGIFQRYIPEVAEALSIILERDKDEIARQFQAALPNFVRLGQTTEGAEAAAEEAPPAPSMLPPADSAAPPSMGEPPAGFDNDVSSSEVPAKKPGKNKN